MPQTIDPAEQTLFSQDSASSVGADVAADGTYDPRHFESDRQRPFEEPCDHQDDAAKANGTYVPSSDDAMLSSEGDGDVDHGVDSDAGAPETIDPTGDTYGDLMRAFDHFNATLFEGKLSPCLITLRASGRTLGYFSANRFVRPDGRLTHEIAMNCDQFGASTIENSLSTLVHEMVHQLQFEKGTAGRKAYHNQDFADSMQRIGLPTSNTGRPGGKIVGEQMSHYIDPEGLFLAECRKLIDSGFRARWADRFATRTVYEYFPGDPAPAAGEGEGTKAEGKPSPSAGSYQGGEPSLLAKNPELFTAPKPKDPSKTKFQCPECRVSAWGRSSLKILCIPCGLQMTLVEQLPTPKHSRPTALD